MQYTALYMKASSACNSMIRNKHHVFGILKSVIIHILKVGVIKTNKSRHQYQSWRSNDSQGDRSTQKLSSGDEPTPPPNLPFLQFSKGKTKTELKGASNEVDCCPTYQQELRTQRSNEQKYVASED